MREMVLMGLDLSLTSGGWLFWDNPEMLEVS